MDSLPTERSGKPLEIERLVNYRNLLLVFGGYRTGGEAQEMQTAREAQKSHPPTCRTRRVTVLPGKRTPLVFSLNQRSPAFLAPGIGFVEDSFSMDGDGGIVLGLPAAHFLSYGPFPNGPQTGLGPWGWGPMF